MDLRTIRDTVTKALHEELLQKFLHLKSFKSRLPEGPGDCASNASRNKMAPPHPSQHFILCEVIRDIHILPDVQKHSEKFRGIQKSSVAFIEIKKKNQMNSGKKEEKFMEKLE
ncbi:putative ribonuclease FAU-1 [Frankliniella fusca]|uniref:Ribonuclease FAU-1 n=1 Tax=Frankliniella fusca TaxID=407009 RepID=A0AAE1LKT4_9NEOP|nr:putative ribonuclease FAU-1 [Frankliniella fusca]